MAGITKKQFRQYELVRASGATNMFDVDAVGALSGLDRPTIISIMQQYRSLLTKWSIT